MSSLLKGYKVAFSGFNRNIKLIIVFYILTSIAAGMQGVLLNLYYLKMGMDESFLGSVVLIQSLVMGIFGIPFGILADRAKKHVLVKAAFITSNIFFTLILLTDEPTLVLVLNGLQYVSVALTVAAEFPYVAENVSEQGRTHLFSINFIIFSIGPSLGSPLGGYLPEFFGRLAGVDASSPLAYRLSMLATAGVFWLGGLFVMRIGETKSADLPISAPSSAAPRRRGGLKFNRSGVVIGMALHAGFVAVAASMFVPFMNVIFNQRFNLPTHVIGWLFTVQNIFMALSVLFIPKWGEAKGKLMGAAILEGITIPLYLMLALSGNLHLFLMAYVARMVFANAPGPLLDSYAMAQVLPGERARASAALNLSRQLMWALGGKLGGSFLKNKEYSLPLLLATMFYSLAVLVLTVMTKHPKTREHLAKEGAVAIAGEG